MDFLKAAWHCCSPELAPISHFVMPFRVVEVRLLIELVIDLIRVIPHEPIPAPNLGILKSGRNVWLSFGFRF